jgi:hypothetical protein
MANNSLRFEEFTALRKRQGNAANGGGVTTETSSSAARVEAEVMPNVPTYELAISIYQFNILFLDAGVAGIDPET